MADRVIILDVRRANEELRPRDIQQMCVHKDTRIMVSDFDYVYRKASDLSIGNKVCGISDGSLSTGVIEKIWRRRNKAKEITFMNGTSLILSNHPLLNWDGEWVSSDKIQLNDKIRIIQKSSVRNNSLGLKELFIKAAKKCNLYVRLSKEEKLDLLKCDKDFFDWVKPKSIYKIRKNGIIPIQKASMLNINIRWIRSKNGSEFDLNNLCEESFSWIIGMIASDGNIKFNKTHSLFRIYQSKKEYIEKTIKALGCSKIKYLFSSVDKKKNGNIGWDICVNSYPLVCILNELGITPKKTRTLDLEKFSVLHSTLKVNIISGMIDGDGSLEKGQKSVRLCSASQKVLKNIKDWLLELGIASGVSLHQGKECVFGYRTDTKHWILYISKFNIRKLQKRISISVKLKDAISIKKNTRPLKGDCFYTRVKEIKNVGAVDLINFQISPIETFICEDIITHNCGRAGRIHGENTEADVHFIVTNDDLRRWQEKLDNPSSYEIRSNLNDLEVFAFHVISHIVRGIITDRASFYDWYDRTLDKFQRESRGEKTPDYHEIAQELHKTGSAEYNETTSEIKPKPLGKICAAYYFSPYDVRDWFANICELNRRDLLWDDSCQAWALANIRSAMEWENDAIKANAERVIDRIACQRLPIKKGVVARLLATDCVLHGRRPKCDLPVFYSVKNDLSRILTAWEAIGKVSRRVLGNISSFVETLQLRQQYGVPSKLTHIIKLPGIGKTTAKALYENYDVHSPKQLQENYDFIYENASSGVKRSLTNYKKHLKKGSTSPEEKVSYKPKSRSREGQDEFGDL